MIMYNEIYFLDAYMCCTMRCILYGRVYVENMILVSELYCYYMCLFYQMWVSAVQEQNMVNRKGVKIIVKEYSRQDAVKWSRVHYQ